MKNNYQRLPWFGAALVVLGIVMLLDKLSILEIRFAAVFWPLVMLLGIGIVTKGFSRNATGKVFWGTLIFLYALFFFLRSIDALEIRGHLFLPGTFLILGFAFLMLFLNNVKEWFFLLPACILGGIGLLFILVEYDYLYGWEVWDLVHRYWPIALILVGLAVILRRKEQHHTTPPTQA